MLRRVFLLSSTAILLPFAIWSCDETAERKKLVTGDVIITDENGERVHVPAAPPAESPDSRVDEMPALTERQIADMSKDARTEDRPPPGAGTPDPATAAAIR